MIPLTAVYKNIHSMRNPIWFLRFVRFINYCEHFQIILQKKKCGLLTEDAKIKKKLKITQSFFQK